MGSGGATGAGTTRASNVMPIPAGAASAMRAVEVTVAIGTAIATATGTGIETKEDDRESAPLSVAPTVRLNLTAPSRVGPRKG